MATTTDVPLIDALRNIPVFEGLTEDQLGWFTANAEDVRYAPGEIIVEAGGPADRLARVCGGGEGGGGRGENWGCAAVLADDPLPQHDSSQRPDALGVSADQPLRRDVPPHSRYPG